MPRKKKKEVKIKRTFMLEERIANYVDKLHRNRRRLNYLLKWNVKSKSNVVSYSVRKMEQFLRENDVDLR